MFKTEADLCSAFIRHATADRKWVAYPETGGFDILLVRSDDGFQIGIEAKLRLNAKVICQAAEPRDQWSATNTGPDCRAVLVPYDKIGTELACLLPLLNITGIGFVSEKCWTGADFTKSYPPLPDPVGGWQNSSWIELCPYQRCKLPAYIPDVSAGNPSPVQLTAWKIMAIRMAVLLEKQGYLTRPDFKRYGIDMGRWTQGMWLVPGSEKGQWIAGTRLPNFRQQHPINFAQIENDYAKWAIKE